mgnify:CR=1 FL=1
MTARIADILLYATAILCPEPYMSRKRIIVWAVVKWTSFVYNSFTSRLINHLKFTSITGIFNISGLENGRIVADTRQRWRSGNLKK